VAKFTPIMTKLEKAAQAGLRDVGRAVLKEAQRRSPTLTGESDDSGFVAVDDLTAQVGFTSMVSRLQHEDLDAQHENGEEPKFLESAVDTVDGAPILAARLRKDLGGG
jgi:hypothetical protein